MKIIEIIGARPQFIKAAVVSKQLRKFPEIKDLILHTGQHYDENMSKVFFDELQIPKPDYNLNVGSGNHGKQTALMLEGIEKILIDENPDWVIVYGDTNSTIAGSLAASKLHIKVAHVEAGLRSFNRLMPEEINRITTDHISDILFAPTQNAMSLLEKEGLKERSFFSGDVMFDSVLFYQNLAEEKFFLNQITDLNEFYLATIHRQENTDDTNRLQNIFTAFSNLDFPVLLPLHPRTQKYLPQIKFSENVKIINPVSYLEMLILLKNCKKVLTDSGGLQKEAYFLQKQCITLREETEWIETLENNWNFIVGPDVTKIINSAKLSPTSEQKKYFGDGNAGELIANYLQKIY
ncbi:MAG: UDP-N-acetylglucosamine 2-epimerase (non-hydrolyzing) [Ignavibacteriae bacterium]|nr:UDP-N-acetylglucosamine 2-epimerase (non-hydrolyzing) [Ignavibacteriota bacterium]